MRIRSHITSEDGTVWYYEQEGSGPNIVLIPDGLGECELFDKPMSIIAAQGYTVTTFDMPGMSRSSNAPSSTYQDVTAQKLAKSVIGVLDKLNINFASFWGCSSAASTVLVLCIDFPDRVRNVLAHEAPMITHDFLKDLPATDPGTISSSMAAITRSMSSNETAWDNLGSEVHNRLKENYVRWAHGYPLSIPQSCPTDVDVLRGKPIDWTVGASTQNQMFFDNIVIATKAGVPISTLPGQHFPYVSHPDIFANHVVQTTRKYL
ncbi:hypothetical protein LTR84_009166 [Exophiala bonariae]|uniref:AB hydrolase-1 domain-containing protein n=1 Tax=Exophiala bonariae TaxID=1690606 RepID=A0AAV9MV62_9EURO|nr:hypothetical protein LTR84_009166 [Exophiala bonariae]